MKLRSVLALVMMLACAPAMAQVNPGTSPLSGAKGGTNNAFMQFTGPAASLKTYTVPNASGTLAMLAQIQTWTGVQTFSGGINVGVIAPLADGTTALRINNFAQTHNIVTIDSTNFRVGINKTPGAFDLDVNGPVSFASTLAVTGHLTFEGVTSTGATGTGNLVFGTAPVITLSNATGLPTTALTGTLQAAQEPAHTGNVTNSAGSLALTIGAGQVTNAMQAATMGAYSFKCNNTAGAASPTDCDATAFTSKASPVAGDLVVIQDSAASNAYKKTTVGALASAGSVSSVNAQTGPLVLWPFPQGRLTLTSGTPVMATSVAGATTVYYTGYAGKNVPIYNGTAVAVYQLCAANTVGACELSVALGSNWGANSNYDWFIALNGGSPALCSGPAWVSDTSRGSGAGTTQLAQLDGLNTNAVSLPNCRINNTTTISVAANQATFVASMRTGSAGQTNFIYGASAAGGTAGLFGIWNEYNRITVRTTVNDSNASWNYTSATVRPVDNSTANRVSFLSGLSESGFTWTYATTITFPAAAANAFFQIGGALDSTTTFDRNGTALNATTTGMHLPISVKNDYNPTIGWHFVQALEGGDGTNANTSGGTTQQAFTFEFEM